MARTTNRSTIRSKIRIKADRPSTVNPTDAELNTMIDSAWTHLYDMLVTQEPERFLEYEDITISSGTMSYDLPESFFKNYSVAVEDSSKPDGYSYLARHNNDEQYDYSYTQDKEFASYFIKSGKIYIHPTPNWSGTIRLEFIPYAEEWDDTTTINTYNGWDEWIVYQVCADLAILDKEDPSGFMVQQSKIENRILKSNDLDIGEPKSVVNDFRRSKYSPYQFWTRKK